VGEYELKPWVRAVFAIALLLLPTAPHAQAEKRIALLIGNQGYGGEIGCLANPHNDVGLLENTPNRLGFEVRDGARRRPSGLAPGRQRLHRLQQMPSASSTTLVTARRTAAPTISFPSMLRRPK
jgi:caspase domain-containing protein